MFFWYTTQIEDKYKKNIDKMQYYTSRRYIKKNIDKMQLTTRLNFLNHYYKKWHRARLKRCIEPGFSWGHKGGGTLLGIAIESGFKNGLYDV